MSVTTLSVSIFTSGWPTFTALPLSTYHSMMIPAVSPSPISGNLKIYLITSEFYCSFNLVEDLLRGDHVMVFSPGIRYNHIKRSHPLRRCFEVEECLLVGHRHDLRSHTEASRLLTDKNEPSGLLDRCCNCLLVKGVYSSQVYQLHRVSCLFRHHNCLLHLAYHGAVGNHGNVGAPRQDLGFADRH